MPNLESFSLRARVSDQHAQVPGFHFPGTAIRTLLDGLLPSVRNVEFDDCCCEVWRSWDQPLRDEEHVCLSLKELLPRLDNLRLRCATICEAIFPSGPVGKCRGTGSATSTGAENTFVLNTIQSNSTWPTHHCFCTLLTDDPHALLPKNGPICNFLLPLLRSAIADGKLDNFQQHSLIDNHNPLDNSRRQYATTSERLLGSQEKLIKSPYMAVRTDSPAYALRSLGNDGKPVEVVGGWNDVMVYNEGQKWVETLEGCRFAAGYIKARTRFRGVEFKRSDLSDRETLISRTKATCGLWDLEDKEGRILLEGEILDTLENTSFITRKPTQKELRREERKKAIERGEEVSDHPDSSQSEADEEEYGDSEFGDEDDGGLSERDTDNSDDSEGEEDEDGGGEAAQARLGQDGIGPLGASFNPAMTTGAPVDLNDWDNEPLSDNEDEEYQDDDEEAEGADYLRAQAAMSSRLHARQTNRNPQTVRLQAHSPTMASAQQNLQESNDFEIHHHPMYDYTYPRYPFQRFEHEHIMYNHKIAQK